ncbi:hypothetical protein Mycsm_01813 [Mycobacterium sp. JS623]|uniref:hypothetical protein n=1 Tax=Mycobacterium sp. JS623 TaxID=212767 RepID=UPI0002A5574C|nr:hypothetical protein [Mycobacterium sp. JS623]AGB22200.1 hypothetical protein Mycsm_01813 [Mycobacterium sp. JS623]
MAMTTFAVALNAEQVAQMRSLAADLANDVDGLADRARAVGYVRESMHLQPTEDGGALLLVHLDCDIDDPGEVRRRIRAYPPTDFTRWFNPRFEALMPSGRVPTNVEPLFEWRDQS